MSDINFNNTSNKPVTSSGNQIFSGSSSGTSINSSSLLQLFNTNSTAGNMSTIQTYNQALAQTSGIDFVNTNNSSSGSQVGAINFNVAITGILTKAFQITNDGIENPLLLMPSGEIIIGGSISDNVFSSLGNGLYIGSTNPYPSVNLGSISSNNNAPFPAFNFYNSNGTAAAPTATQNSDYLGGLYWLGYNSNFNEFTNGASIQVSSLGTWTGTSSPAFLSISPTYSSNSFGNINSTTTGIGLLNVTTFPSTVTAATYGFKSILNSFAASYTLTEAANYFASGIQKGSGSTITRFANFYATPSTNGTNNAVFTDNVNYTGNFFIHQLGTLASQFAGPINSTSAQTTVSNSTSGSTIFSQPFQGSSYKKVVIYCNAAVGTASYSFPTVFSHTPAILTTNELASTVITTLTTSTVTVTGATSTGFLIIEGY